MGKKNKRKAIAEEQLVSENSGVAEQPSSPTDEKGTKKKKRDHRATISENGVKGTKTGQSLSKEGGESEHTVAASTAASVSVEKNEAAKGIDEIDALFASKKETELIHKKQEVENEKRLEEQRKLFRKNSSNGSSTSNKNLKCIELSQDRSDVGKIRRGEWANDGLGGVFDVDGFTGRKQEGTGYKIYKAHLFNKEGFGNTKDCPFDCKCCYI
mmetsp:Transcript_4621/g.5669  ORF Transcript_4621/g.5669 Transcript_4621/m.5669 type:complete len:213 (-) Transcript_4621:831-1469(-)